MNFPLHPHRIAGQRPARAQAGWIRRAFLLGAFTIAMLALVVAKPSVLLAQNFDRPGGDYLNSPIASGDPAECALLCERDRRCRAWSFNYPLDPGAGAVCWLKNTVPSRVQNSCCISGVRGAGVVEPKSRAVETSIDRPGGDYRSFAMRDGEGEDDCRSACDGEGKCRAWTFARPGYVGREPHCWLKTDIKPPRRKAGFSSGVVR